MCRNACYAPYYTTTPYYTEVKLRHRRAPIPVPSFYALPWYYYGTTHDDALLLHSSLVLHNTGMLTHSCVIYYKAFRRGRKDPAELQSAEKSNRALTGSFHDWAEYNFQLQLSHGAFEYLLSFVCLYCSTN